MNTPRLPSLLAPLLAVVGCAGAEKGTAKSEPPTAADAKAFVAKVNDEVKSLWIDSTRAEWIKSTYITGDTEALAAAANEKTLGYVAGAIKTAARFDGLELDPDTARQLHLLKVSSTLPAPSDDAKRKELTQLAAKLEGLYGRGKYCRGEVCRDLQELSAVLAGGGSYEEQLDAWAGWHSIARPMRPMYTRFVELANEGGKEIGFPNLGVLWRSAYDMTPDEFEAETDRLWNQVKPMYDQLHCYVRAKLSAKYGADKVPASGPIPAHLLGNMWAQEWSNVYPMVEPYKGQASIDVTAALQKKKELDAKGLVKIGENFFTSLGLKPLPATFWERSMFVKPKDRDVVCHASAWDLDFGGGDIRLKMCIKIDEEDLITVHHELGHNYYYLYYNHLPPLYQGGANDGFHEAIGDALALSITPGYLKKLGFLEQESAAKEAVINLQMKDALDKIAFLPFGRVIDQWRWDVFAGKIAPAEYNASWWKLREKYQGIRPAAARGEEEFDAGAKYHIPANVPYIRYFLARILQFQFHAAMCKAAGHEGPLYTCSIYGNQAVGERLGKMLAMGSSRPWRDALEALTGEREMNAEHLLAYFEPLRTWLAEQNQGQTCGW